MQPEVRAALGSAGLRVPDGRESRQRPSVWGSRLADLYANPPPLHACVLQLWRGGAGLLRLASQPRQQSAEEARRVLALKCDLPYRARNIARNWCARADEHAMPLASPPLLCRARRERKSTRSVRQGRLRTHRLAQVLGQPIRWKAGEVDRRVLDIALVAVRWREVELEGGAAKGGGWWAVLALLLLRGRRCGLDDTPRHLAIELRTR